MSYLGSIGNTMKGSGIAECLQVVYGENAVQHYDFGQGDSESTKRSFSVTKRSPINNHWTTPTRRDHNGRFGRA